MKTLTVLRHAKSGWDDPDLRDFDRPLNAKGQRAAQFVGRNLKSMANRAAKIGTTVNAIALL